MRHYLIEQEVFEDISSRWINELLRRADIRPHKNKYWLTSKDKTDPLYDIRIANICNSYRTAIELYQTSGVHTICIDEQTGIQALERIAEDRLVRPGQIAKREYEYIRHGTLCLFGNYHVATGQVLAPIIRETRTETDFLENLDNVILLDPDGRYRIICDNLTTHCSESIVRYVAEACQIKVPLGRKGGSGILQSVKSRVAFLSDPTHRIQFLFTPRHCSWMNQIEIWFGTLRKKLTRWLSARSLNVLRESVLTFIDYYNTNHSHPYNWTYTGRVLSA